MIKRFLKKFGLFLILWVVLCLITKSQDYDREYDMLIGFPFRFIETEGIREFGISLVNFDKLKLTYNLMIVVALTILVILKQKPFRRKGFLYYLALNFKLISSFSYPALRTPLHTLSPHSPLQLSFQYQPTISLIIFRSYIKEVHSLIDLYFIQVDNKFI